GARDPRDVALPRIPRRERAGAREVHPGRREARSRREARALEPGHARAADVDRPHAGREADLAFDRRAVHGVVAADLLAVDREDRERAVDVDGEVEAGRAAAEVEAAACRAAAEPAVAIAQPADPPADAREFRLLLARADRVH